MTRLSVVIPHWPLDGEADAALRACVASFPPEVERIVVVNEGTGYGRNVNVGLRLATGDYIAVVNNDCRLDDARLPATVRLTRGRDIAAACGQLAATR